MTISFDDAAPGGPGWEWFIEPTDREPIGIARKRTSLHRWRWHVVVFGGLTYATDSEVRARRIRRQKLNAQVTS